MSSPQKLPSDIIRVRRSGARLAAVQALYLMEATDRGAKSVIREFMEDRLGLDDDGQPVEDADPDLFKQIVNGIVAQQSSHRRGDHLPARQRAGGLIALIRRPALYCVAQLQELATRADLSNAVIIEEYVGIAHAFFDGEEPKFINGVLDRVAKDVRPDGIPVGLNGK